MRIYLPCRLPARVQLAQHGLVGVPRSMLHCRQRATCLLCLFWVLMRGRRGARGGGPYLRCRLCVPHPCVDKCRRAQQNDNNNSAIMPV